MSYEFKGNSNYTLGVELELQLVDRETCALANTVQQILKRVPEEFADSIKPEFMQSYCEINTAVCQNVTEVEQDLATKLDWLYKVTGELGMGVIWAGSHPFSLWKEQVISPGERYAWLMDTMQYVARRLVCFGLHVHVGVDTGDKAIQMCDRLLRHLPTLLALSANSPLWCGMNTGMASHRSKIMEALPTAGLPFTMRNWSEYVWLVDHLIATNFLHSIREIWWDVRPHHLFGTVEIRIMDMPLNLHHTMGLVALCQSLVAAISENIDRGAYLYDCHPMIAKQNKWHAARYGMNATFVDSDTMKAVPARETARKLMERCSEQAERLGCLEQMYYLNDIIEGGTGAERQCAVYERNRDAHEVARFLADQHQQSAVKSAAKQPEGSVKTV